MDSQMATLYAFQYSCEPSSLSMAGYKLPRSRSSLGPLKIALCVTRIHPCFGEPSPFTYSDRSHVFIGP